MSGITLEWSGREYVIPAAKAFAVGEQVENVITLAEISAMSANPKFFKIARAFAVMLRFAGCKVSDQEVHAEIMASLLRAAKDGNASAETVFGATAMKQLSDVLTMGMSHAMGADADAGEATAQATTSV